VGANDLILAICLTLWRDHRSHSKMFIILLKRDRRSHFRIDVTGSDYVVDVDSVSNSNFRSRLDRFWLDQPVMFNWKADLTGTGSRSFSCDIRVDWSCIKF